MDEHSSPRRGAVERKEAHSQELDELRRILLQEDRRDWSGVRARLEELAQPEQLAERLPQAMRIRQAKDEQLTLALTESVEEALGTSVRRNPKMLAEAIFPVIGPAIRRSIAQAIQSMVQSLNQTLDHSLSLRSWGWRIEAWKSGRSFAEVVLLKTLLYRVEQVFLIHRETSLLLHHVAVPNTVGRGVETMSGMLSAIQDFVKDSLEVDSEAALDSFRVGELEVWVEQGPSALLALVVRGQPPRSVRRKLSETLESLHREHHRDLADFTGDDAPFVHCGTAMQDCLLSADRFDHRRRNPLALVVSVLLVVFLSVVGILWFFDHLRLGRFVDRLRAEPGYFVLESDRGLRHLQVEGMRDPLSRTPEALLDESQLDPRRVDLHFHLVAVFDPEFLLRRVRKILKDSGEVKVEARDATVVLSGSATTEWLERSLPVLRSIVGVDDVDTTQLAVQGGKPLQEGTGQ